MARRSDTSAPGDSEALAAEWVAFRELITVGRSAEAMLLADRICAETDDPLRIAQALIEKLAAMINRRAPLHAAPLLDRISDELRQRDRHPRLTGEYHVLAGYVAFADGSLSAGVSNLAHAERALRQMTEANVAAVDTWHDLSVVYSAMGFHAKALEAMRAGRALCETAGIPVTACACLETLVRAAVARDHQGATEDCVRELREVVRFGRAYGSGLELQDQVYLWYAAARLGAAGHPEPGSWTFPEGLDSALAAVLQFAGVADAIADGRPAHALKLLGAVSAAGSEDVLGEAEPHRLRSIAYVQLGDDTAALDAERAVLRAVTRDEAHLRDRYIDSVNARLDQDRLREVARRHADAAMSDPLTGLPNRRRIDAFVAELADRGVDAAIGLLDLDGFKLVNDTHGHGSGDLVLQRFAGVLAQSVRAQDLPARFGGDEFMVILPGTGLAEAREVGERIVGAVAAEDWEALVPGTPVGVSMGWAALSPGDDLRRAVRAADDELYRVKRAPRPR